ncbi:MAG TPA: hypothetical protein VNK95_13905, partial [Caldilineaceae bacterium]|nr:hypothetical protein [Caldilineaceae bacterium]
MASERLHRALRVRPLGIVLALILLLNWGPAAMPATAQGTLPPLRWPALTLTRLPGDFVQPVHIAHAGDGSGRLFVVERAGVIRIIQDGAVLPTPFLDLEERVNDSCG